MAATSTVSNEDITAVMEALSGLPVKEFASSLKDLPSETVIRMQKLETLTPDQLKAVNSHLKSAQKEDGYVLLKERLNAWWRGDDVKFKKTKPRTAQQSEKPVPPELDPRRWSPNSIKMSEELWGEGFAEPGGALFAKKLLSPFKFDASNSFLDLSAGLGGTASILAKEYKMWLDAYEPNEELVIAGQKNISRNGLSKKVPLQAVDLEKLSLPERKYDQVYTRESLFMVENKKNIIQQIGKTLKKKGHVIIVDYMVGDDSNPEDMKLWKSHEREDVHLWTAELYQNALSHYGISVWSINDFSQEYLELIHEGWNEVIDKINTGDFDRKFVDHLLHEGDVWLHRARALESGTLALKRIHAVV